MGLFKSLGIDDRVAEIIARLCCYNGHLPQGAPTSPVLSNMICFRLDTELLQIAKEARAIYTRYADDVTFSSYQPPALLFDGVIPAVGRFSTDRLSKPLKMALDRNGFFVHPDKAHYADRNSRRIVTGVKINEGLNVDRRYVRSIRAILHSVETFGHDDAGIFFLSSGGRGALSDHLRGKISYIAHLKGQTDPVVRSLAQRYSKSFGGKPIKLTPTDIERRDRSVWVVDHPEAYGSAFFLSEIGLVTAAHCAKGVTEVSVLHPTKHTTTFPAKVLHYDEDRDIAILDRSMIPETEYYELSASTAPAAVGDPVVAIGYPDWGLGERCNIRPGTVSSLTARSGLQLLEVTQQLMQGMSGGPILNSSGEVVGIVHKGGPEEGRQFGIRLSELFVSIQKTAS